MVAIDMDMDKEGFLNIIKSIINTRGSDGATVNEIKRDYLELTGETLYERNYDENNCLINLINQIEDVKSQRLKHGAVVYYCESKKSHHINKMIDKQKVPNRKRKLSVCKKDFSMEYKKRRESKGQFYGYDFLGDDFFMSVCSYEFGLNFERNNYGVLSVGNNISGMTLREASRMVMTTHYLSKRLIVNIGSVDLMNGRDIMDMKFDFLGLMAAFEYRGIEPIITTLAPLANYCHMEDVRNNLLKFNHYLMSHKYRWNVVDIHSTFVSNNGCTLFSCYQPGPRKSVSGSEKPHVLWNNIGRGRVLQMIKSHISHFQN